MLGSRLGRVAVLAVGLCSFGFGCAGGGAEGPKLAPASGTVTIDKKPVAGVVVTFSPTAQGVGAGAFGVTDESGKYELVHHSGRKGIEPGNYAVVFSRMTKPDGSPLPPGQSPTEVEAVESIPERFRTVAKPVHTATVPPEGGSSFDFDINAK